MAAFQRPGARSSNVFGIAFSADRDGSGGINAGAASQQQRRSATAQRELSPFARQQRQVLHAIETHAVAIIATDDATGKNLACFGPGIPPLFVSARVDEMWHCRCLSPCKARAEATAALSTGRYAKQLQQPVQVCRRISCNALTEPAGRLRSGRWGVFSSFPFLWSKVYATFHRMYDQLVGEAGMPGLASKRLCPCVRWCARTRSASRPSTRQPQPRTTWASASAPASATAFHLRRSAPQYVQISVGCFKIYGFVLKLCGCSIAAIGPCTLPGPCLPSQLSFCIAQGVTCMRHCTDDILVREVATDPLLSSYRSLHPQSYRPALQNVWSVCTLAAWLLSTILTTPLPIPPVLNFHIPDVVNVTIWHTKTRI